MAEFDLAKYSEVIDFMKAAHGNQIESLYEGSPAGPILCAWQISS